MAPPPGPDAARRRRPHGTATADDSLPSSSERRKEVPGMNPAAGNEEGAAKEKNRGRGRGARGGARRALSDYLAESRAEERERRRIERRIADAQRGSGRILAGLYLASVALLAAALLVAGWWMQRKSGGGDGGAVPASKLVVKMLTGAARFFIHGGGGGGSVASSSPAGSFASASASSLRTTTGLGRPMRIVSAYPPGVSRGDVERLTQGMGWPEEEKKYGGAMMNNFVIPGWRAMVLEPRGLDRRVAVSASREVKLRNALALDARGRMSLATWGSVRLEVLDSDDVREAMLKGGGKGRGALAERCAEASGIGDDPDTISRLFRGDLRGGAGDYFRLELWKWCSLLAGEADAYIDLTVEAEVPYGLGEVLDRYRGHGKGIVAMTDDGAEGKEMSAWAHPSFLVLPPPPSAARGKEGESSKFMRTTEVHTAARDVARRAVRFLVELNDSEIEEVFSDILKQRELGGRTAEWLFGPVSSKAAADGSKEQMWSRWTADCHERRQHQPEEGGEDEGHEDEGRWLLKRCDEFVPRSTAASAISSQCCYFHTHHVEERAVGETLDGERGLRG